MYPAEIAEHNLTSNALLTRRRQLRADCKLKMKNANCEVRPKTAAEAKELMRLRHLNRVNID
jgi:hypothetical protein